MAAKQYVVLNPRGISPSTGRDRVHILRVDKPKAKRFYEGDALTASDLPAGALKTWLARGFVKAV